MGILGSETDPMPSHYKFFNLRNMKKLIICLFIMCGGLLWGQNYSYQLAILKYNGGGDWYANPTALTNLILFTNANLGTSIAPEYEVVEASSPDLFTYPFIHMTGHGNVVFNEEEARALRLYLEAGGFLHIDDNYGMDKFIRPEIQKIFPEAEWREIPANHPIFSQHYLMKDGLPKIHEHDRQPPQAFGIFIKGRLALFYTYESDLSDGWEDPEVHNDPPEARQKALRMGANILEYVFKGEPGS